jgi:hypothetical protein
MHAAFQPRATQRVLLRVGVGANCGTIEAESQLAMPATGTVQELHRPGRRKHRCPGQHRYRLDCAVRGYFLTATLSTSRRQVRLVETCSE